MKTRLLITFGIFLFLIGFSVPAFAQSLEEPDATSNYFSDQEYKIFSVIEGAYEYNVPYKISGAKISTMDIDCDSTEIIIYLESTNDGSLVINIPRKMLDSRFNGSDDEFFVILDGKEVAFEESYSDAESRTLEIPFSKDSQVLEIIITQLISQDPKSQVTCGGIGAAKSPYYNLLSPSNQSSSIIPPPLKQMKMGIKLGHIICDKDKSPVWNVNEEPACVFSDSEIKLINRGWAKLRLLLPAGSFPEHEMNLTGWNVMSLMLMGNIIEGDKPLETLEEKQEAVWEYSQQYHPEERYLEYSIYQPQRYYSVGDKVEFELLEWGIYSECWNLLLQIIDENDQAVYEDNSVRFCLEPATEGKGGWFSSYSMGEEFEEFVCNKSGYYRIVVSNGEIYPKTISQNFVCLEAEPTLEPLQIIVDGEKQVRRGTTHTIEVQVVRGDIPVEGARVFIDIEDYGENIIREFKGYTDSNGYFVFSWAMPQSFDDVETLLAIIDVTDDISAKTELFEFQVYCLPGEQNCKVEGN